MMMKRALPHELILRAFYRPAQVSALAEGAAQGRATIRVPSRWHPDGFVVTWVFSGALSANGRAIAGGAHALSAWTHHICRLGPEHAHFRARCGCDAEERVAIRRQCCAHHSGAAVRFGDRRRYLRTRCVWRSRGCRYFCTAASRAADRSEE